MARGAPANAGYTIINGAGTGPTGYKIDVWIEYKVIQQDIINNRSQISAIFYACLNPDYTSSTRSSNGCYSSFSVNGVSGVNLRSNSSYNFTGSSILNPMGTWDGWVDHNADGTLTINMAGSFTTDSSYITGGNAAGNVTLPTIPRATTPIIPALTMQHQGTIDLSSRASSLFTHTLSYVFGAANGTIIEKTANTSVNWTPPVSLAAQIPNSVSGTCVITCKTYSGDTLIGTVNVNVTLSVPNAEAPEFFIPGVSSLTVTKQSENAIITGWNELVKGYSAVKLTAVAVGIYGSTITSYMFEVLKGGITVQQSQIQAGNEWTSPILMAAGTDYTVRVTITDSRGRVNHGLTGCPNVYDYSPPGISLTDIFRSNIAGLKDLVNGTYVSAKGTFSFSSVNNRNTVTKKIEYRQYGAANWITGKDGPDNNVAYVFGLAMISTSYSYEVRLSVTDAISPIVMITALIRPGLVTWHIRPGGRGLGIGGAADADELQVYFKSQFKDDVTIAAGKALKIGAVSVGDVTGPAAALDNAIARFDALTGKLLQSSLVTIDDNGTVNLPAGQAFKINNVTYLGNVTNEAQIPKSIVDAKGDLLAGTANDAIARLAVGTDGQVLKALSSAAAGMAWDYQHMRMVGSNWNAGGHTQRNSFAGLNSDAGIIYLLSGIIINQSGQNCDFSLQCNNVANNTGFYCKLSRDGVISPYTNQGYLAFAVSGSYAIFFAFISALGGNWMATGNAIRSSITSGSYEDVNFSIIAPGKGAAISQIDVAASYANGIGQYSRIMLHSLSGPA